LLKEISGELEISIYTIEMLLFAKAEQLVKTMMKSFS